VTDARWKHEVGSTEEEFVRSEK